MPGGNGSLNIATEEPKNYCADIVEMKYPKGKFYRQVCFFSNYKEYAYLPNFVKKPETRAQYDAWWKWHDEYN